MMSGTTMLWFCVVSFSAVGRRQPLVLLRQKFDRLYFVIRTRQQGHRGKRATRASINRRRTVAMEFGM